MLTHLHVIVLSNKPTNKHTSKQIPVKTSNVLRYATTLGHDSLSVQMTFKMADFQPV